ncbi:hypothetical protein ACO0QE_001425 [Hanseniaspora vineae]
MSNTPQSTSSLIDSSSAAMSSLYSGVAKADGSGSESGSPLINTAPNGGDAAAGNNEAVKHTYKDSEAIEITLEDLRQDDEDEVDIPVDIPYMKASGSTTSTTPTQDDISLKNSETTKSNSVEDQSSEQKQTSEPAQGEFQQGSTHSDNKEEPLHAGTVTKVEENKEEEEEEQVEAQENVGSLQHEENKHVEQTEQTSGVSSLPAQTSSTGVSTTTLSPAPKETVGNSIPEVSQESPESDISFGTEVIKGGSVFDSSEEDAQTAYDAAKDYKSIMNRSPIVIFSKTYCPFSQALKDLLLSEKSLYKFEPEPVVVEFDTMENNNGPILQEYVKEQTGRKTVPNLIVGGLSRGGSDDIHALHEKDALYESFEEWCGTLCKVSKVLAPEA